MLLCLEMIPTGTVHGNVHSLPYSLHPKIFLATTRRKLLASGVTSTQKSYIRTHHGMSHWAQFAPLGRWDCGRGYSFSVRDKYESVYHSYDLPMLIFFLYLPVLVRDGYLQDSS